MSEPVTTETTKMPQLHQAADEASLAGQAAYLTATKIRLALLVAAAGSGISSWRVGGGDIDVLALLSLLCFVGALVAEVYLLGQRPERRWYDGRAVAESVKTLAWKFAVCGNPFPRATSTQDASRLLVDRLDALRERFAGLHLAPTKGETITSWMEAIRDASLDSRRETYLAGRIGDQESWYSRNAKLNEEASKRWRIGLLALEIAGAAGAITEAVVNTNVLITPTIAALVGAIVAWIETKRLDQVAPAYAAAVADLSKARAKLKLANNEQSWAIEVDDAEEAISREHTLWLASRSRA